jgi:hypothetical protein
MSSETLSILIDVPLRIGRSPETDDIRNLSKIDLSDSLDA